MRRSACLISALLLGPGCVGCGREPSAADTGCDERELHRDADGDGFGAEEATLRCPGSGWIAQAGDCDDGDAGIHPGADDPPCDGIDADCRIEDLAVVGDVFYATLEEAIAAAGPEDVVRICPGVYPVNVAHEGDLTLEAYDGDPMDTVLTSGGGGSILDVTGGKLTVRDVWFMGSDVEEGGAIDIRDGDLLVEGARFTDLAADRGGALFTEAMGSVTVAGSTFEDLLSRDRGAALWVNEATSVELVGTSFTEGRSYGSAAGALIYADDVRIDGCTFTGNEATGAGGALSVGATLSATILGSEFATNRGYREGGGAIEYSGPAVLHVEDSSFRENVGSGSAVSLDGWGLLSVEIIGGELVGNSGIVVAGGPGEADVLLDGVLVTDNHGGVSVEGAGSSVRVLRSTLHRNVQAYAVFLRDAGRLESVDSDWGEGPDDNEGDLAFDDAEYDDLGAGESFVCDAAGCTF